MWVNVGFSFGFIKMILLMITLAASVYLFFDWNYVRNEIHEKISQGSSAVTNHLNNVKNDNVEASKPAPVDKKPTTDDMFKQSRDDFFKQDSH